MPAVHQEGRADWTNGANDRREDTYASTPEQYERLYFEVEMAEVKVTANEEEPHQWGCWQHPSRQGSPSSSIGQFKYKVEPTVNKQERLIDAYNPLEATTAGEQPQP